MICFLLRHLSRVIKSRIEKTKRPLESRSRGLFYASKFDSEIDSDTHELIVTQVNRG